MSRVYEIDGKPYYSVTTILGILDKPALVPWAAKMTAEAAQQYIYDNGQHDALEGTVTLTAEDVDNMVAESKKAFRAKSKKAMDIGTIVHELIEKHCQTGIAPDLTNDPDEVQTAFNAWLQWVEENDFEPILSEVQVCNPGAGYAGRFDAVARVNGRVTLLDFKTSTGIWDEYKYQLAAYWDAFDNPDIEIESWGILRLDKETGLPEWVTYDPVDMTVAKHAFYHLTRAYIYMKGEPTVKKGKKNGTDNQ